MRKAILAPAIVIGLVTLGVLAHDALAWLMVEHGVAGALLGAGAGGHPPEAAWALLFLGLRIFGLPLAGAAVVGSVVYGATALVNRRSPHR